MATFTKINDWVLYLTKAANISSDTFAVALSNTAPGSETHNPTTDTYGLIANVTQVSYTYCSARTITTTSSNQASGTLSLVLQDLTLTASGGSVGAFRYVYIYDDTVANDPLVALYDYGSSITLATGESILIDFSSLFTLA